MCPNHVENFIDSNLVTSTSLSERLDLWQKYARAPVDANSVTLDFLRKARTGKLFRKGRIKIPRQNRVKVPSYVKDQYARPLPGYPQDDPTVTSTIAARKEDGDADEFVAQLVSLQESLAKAQTKALQEELEVKARERKERKRKKKKEEATVEEDKKKEATTKKKAKGSKDPKNDDETDSDCRYD